MQAIWCYASQSIIFGSRLEQQQQQKYERNRSAMRSHTSSQPANHPANLSSDVACNRTINICSMHRNAIFFHSFLSNEWVATFVRVDALSFLCESLVFGRYLGAIIMYSVDIFYIYFHLRGHIVVAHTIASQWFWCDGAMRCSAWCKSKIYDLKRGNKQCNNQINKLLHRPYAQFLLDCLSLVAMHYDY